MKNIIKSIIVISVFAVLSISCSTNLNEKDLTGFWQGECSRGFQFTDKGTYFFYYIENGAWKCSGDSENNFSVKGNELCCEWTENGETKAIYYSVDSFTRRKMTLRSDPGDISDGKYVKVSKPSHIDVEDRKSALANSVLEQIDSLYFLYHNALDQSFQLSKLELTEKEKLVKPDYLLDLSASNDFVTRSQKINATAIYLVDYAARIAFDMPTDKAKEVIVKLSAEIGHPIDLDYFKKESPLSELIKRDYQLSKENDGLAAFWQFQYAIIVETIYIFSHNVDLFFSKITEDQWISFYKKLMTNRIAIETLAEYDADMYAFKEFMDKTRVTSSDNEVEDILTSIGNSKEFFVANKETQYAIRNALLQ